MPVVPVGMDHEGGFEKENVCLALRLSDMKEFKRFDVGNSFMRAECISVVRLDLIGAKDPVNLDL